MIGRSATGSKSAFIGRISIAASQVFSHAPRDAVVVTEPSPRWGEGSSQHQRRWMGEGPPHPTEIVERAVQPSPQRGEGVNTRVATSAAVVLAQRNPPFHPAVRRATPRSPAPRPEANACSSK